MNSKHDVLDAAEIAQVSGGILEKIEPGEEFDTFADKWNEQILKHQVLWTGKWNKGMLLDW